MPVKRFCGIRII